MIETENTPTLVLSAANVMGARRADKIRVLRMVNIFMDTPEETLADVADLLEEIEVKAGQSVFKKGDLGTSMYMVVDGMVWVHDDEMTLNYLNEGDVFGEMAALDPEPRSASVTAVEDTRLYCLDQHELQALMARAPDIAQGVIHVLCEHLRARVQDMAEDYEYMKQFEKVTSAAAAVEAGIYKPESLKEVTQRTDQLGQLARVFQRMVREVYAREQALKEKIAALHIAIDEARKAQQVAEITETDYCPELSRTLRPGRRQLDRRREHGDAAHRSHGHAVGRRQSAGYGRIRPVWRRPGQCRIVRSRDQHLELHGPDDRRQRIAHGCAPAGRPGAGSRRR